jgi:hypothetical protein
MSQGAIRIVAVLYSEEEMISIYLIILMNIN